MLCRIFELIMIKFGFFLQIFKVAPKFDKSPCIYNVYIIYIVQCILAKMDRREFFIFIIFSDTYTCTYVV